MSRIARTESVGDSLCPVCHEQSEIYAIGPCDHPICYRCSTRMRVLCNQMYCPICRGDLPQIVFLTTKRKYDEVDRRDCIPNRKFKILFEDESVEDAHCALLEHCCRSCDKGPLFDSFPALQNHMRRTHTLFACDLCVSHLKIFPFERRFYNRKDLATHRRTGDADNRSYRGHPLCRFCDERYMDNDELLRHLRKSHYFCHFCDANNSNEYFNDYPDLKEHFRREHFLCQEDQCGLSHTQFTNAFASDIDLKAHMAAEHMGNKSRAQAKELRTIDLNFQMAPRRRGRDAGIISPEDYEELNGSARGHRDRRQRRNDTHQESYSRLDNQTPPPPAASAAATAPRPPALEEDFPTLGNAPPAYVPSAALKKPAEPAEDYPSLSAQRQSASVAVTSSLVSNTARPVKSKPNGTTRPGNQKPNNRFSNIAAAVTSSEVSRPAASVQSRPLEVSRPPPASTNTKTTWAAPRLVSGEDFPTLGSDKQKKAMKGGSNLVSLGVWSKKQKDNGADRRPSSVKGGRQSPSHSKATPVAAVERPFCDDGDFPTLGGAAAPEPAAWVQKNAKPNKNNKNKNTKSSAPLGKIRDVTLIDLKSKPELVNGISDSKTEDIKSKKKKKKQKGKEDDSMAVTLNNSISLSSIANEIDSTALTSEPNSTTTKLKEEKEDVPSVLNSFSDNSVSETGTPLSQCQVLSSSPELGVPAEGKENQKWETVATKKLKPFKEDDFPSLQALPKKSAAPPPGFQRPAKAAAPPPGLSKPASSWGRTPPGLSSTSSVQSPPVQTHSLASSSVDSSSSTSIPMSVKLNMYSYVLPLDASERNRALVKRVQRHLILKEGGFDQFCALSAEFRSGQVNAQMYLRKCQDLFGKEKFLEVLPEMVAMLPDILKQQELAEAHRLVVGGALSLSACPTCHQLLQTQDLTAHVGTHTNLGPDISLAGIAVASLPVQT